MKKQLDVLKETKLESRVRLGIMSILAVNDWVEFKSLRELLGLSDGNLASHIKALEKLAYLEVRKEFVERKPQTTYAMTTKGRIAFEAHLRALEDLLKLGGG